MKKRCAVLGVRSCTVCYHSFYPTSFAIFSFLVLSIGFDTFLFLPALSLILIHAFNLFFNLINANNTIYPFFSIVLVCTRFVLVAKAIEHIEYMECNIGAFIKYWTSSENEVLVH